MGSAVAATVRNSGHEVCWVSEGRSHRTRARAESAGLTDAGTLAHLCETCPVILSVCPPEFAADLAAQVLAHGFRGTYLDANAISPAHKQADRGSHAGRRRPLRRRRNHRAAAEGARPDLAVPQRRARGFHRLSALRPDRWKPRSSEPRSARRRRSRCVTPAQNKGSIALLIAVMGAADRLGVLEDLKRQWTRLSPALGQAKGTSCALRRKPGAGAPEMHEIAATFEAAGMPPEFHRPPRKSTKCCASSRTPIRHPSRKCSRSCESA